LHIIDKKGKLFNPQSYNGSDFIIIANGKRYAIKKVGNLAFKDHKNRTLKLKNVLYVLGIRKDLLFIRKITKENPCNVVYFNKSFTIFYRRIGKVIAHGLKD
jgi:hypothetical protein